MTADLTELGPSRRYALSPTLQAAQGDVTAAMTSVQLALSEHRRLPMPFEHARTQLLYGRQRRRDAASATLREVRATLEHLGTTVWIARAKTKLAQCISGRDRDPGLTATEGRVADLSVLGVTNRDIAATICVSPKTVEILESQSQPHLRQAQHLLLRGALPSTPKPGNRKPSR
jgi:hypothetical protein